MNVKLYLDARACTGACPIKISISHCHKSALLSTGVRVEPSRWDAAKCQVKSGEKRNALNMELQKKLEKVRAMAGYLVAHAECELSASELKKRIVQVLGKNVQLSEEYNLLLGEVTQDRSNQSPLFYPYYLKHMAKYGKGSRDKYEATLSWLMKFEPRITTLTFDDITVKWLQNLDAYMMPSSPSANSRSIHMRNIRTVINRAIDDELTNNYPFRKFKIKQEETEHRALTLNELREFLRMPCEPHQEKYRDMWWLMFLMWGINSADLFNLRKSDIKEGHAIFQRVKTGKWYDVALEPEAMMLMRKYWGKNEYVLSFHDSQDSVKVFRDKVNRGIQGIGRTTHEETAKGKFPNLSTYYARHTWASLLAELDTPIETIALGLGHGKRHVTDIYIRPQLKKVEEANRKLIDYILENKVLTKKEVAMP